MAGCHKEVRAGVHSLFASECAMQCAMQVCKMLSKREGAPLACVCVDPLAGADGDAGESDWLPPAASRRLARLDWAGGERFYADGDPLKVVCVAHAAVDDDALPHA